jgi:hypothetical protein
MLKGKLAIVIFVVGFVATFAGLLLFVAMQ